MKNLLEMSVGFAIGAALVQVVPYWLLVSVMLPFCMALALVLLIAHSNDWPLG